MPQSLTEVQHDLNYVGRRTHVFDRVEACPRDVILGGSQVDMLILGEDRKIRSPPAVIKTQPPSSLMAVTRSLCS